MRIRAGIYQINVYQSFFGLIRIYIEDIYYKQIIYVAIHNAHFAITAKILAIFLEL
jgi:hypothetical protein